MIYLHEPYLDKNDKSKLIKCLNTGWISTAGPLIDEFEKKISRYTGSKYVVACASGTSSLKIALRVLNFNINEEILVPSLTFIASVNSAIYNNLKPYFIDNDNTYTIDTKKLLFFLNNKTKIKLFNKKKYLINSKTQRVIKAIMAVHTFGNACNLDQIYSICKKYNIHIIEDAAESLGTFYKEGKFKNKHTGTIGTLGCLSFNGNKIISTGSGGAILTNNFKFASKARYLINQAKDNKRLFIHNEIGYNYRLNNIQASLGITQLNKIKKILLYKKKIHFFYKNYFKKNKKLTISNTPDYANNNYWLNILEINKKINKHKLNKLIINLENQGIQTRPLWHPNHLQKPYKKYQREKLECIESIYLSRLCLPSSANLTINKLTYICFNIEKYINKLI